MTKLLLVKPSWYHHSGLINSLDIHPDGSRFAMTQTNRICIHHTRALEYLLQHAEHSTQLNSRVHAQVSKCPPILSKPLAIISHHKTDVNCIRFSPNGRFLASASDDTTVAIHQLANRAP